jgi:hemoglobin
VQRTPEEEDTTSFYERVGGHETFVKLIRLFIEGVATDPDLLPMYEADLEGAEHRLLMFFEQYWGGPMTYSLTRGAPMLKMRHMPYKVTSHMRDRWLIHMNYAVTVVGFPPEEESLMRDYIERAGEYLINYDD